MGNLAHPEKATLLGQPAVPPDAHDLPKITRTNQALAAASRRATSGQFTMLQNAVM